MSSGWELNPLWPETIQMHENEASPGQAVTLLVLFLPYLAAEIFKENKKGSQSSVSFLQSILSVVPALNL